MVSSLLPFLLFSFFLFFSFSLFLSFFLSSFFFFPFLPFLSSFFFVSNRPWVAQNQTAHVAIAKMPQRPVCLCASYNIHGHPLELVNSAKYLGVHLDSQHSFSTQERLNHPEPSCHLTTATAARAFIRPTVAYASSTWDTHSQRNTKKLDEQIQQSSAISMLPLSLTTTIGQATRH